MKVTLDRPWLYADLGCEHRVASWALSRPGIVTARRIVWREVRNADLPRDLDAKAWFAHELARVGEGEAIGLLTSLSVARFVETRAEVEDAVASVLATVGLSNAERVGTRSKTLVFPGTINIAVAVNGTLTAGALLEALSIAAEARTAAVMTHGPAQAPGPATGTGTDCIAVAAPLSEKAVGAAWSTPQPYAGKHTALGEAIGRAVLDAVSRGVEDWMTEQTGG
ncbi:MAG: adenosylcobinamide amidohydrolase [Pseudomonadota bacterium]